MQNFDNILYVDLGTVDSAGALKQALSLARNNRAPLKVLALCPDFPKSLSAHREKFEASIVDQAKNAIEEARASLKLGDEEVAVSVEVEAGNAIATRIIRHVLRDSYDLVVKQADEKEDGKGFKAVDMDLLRKCPCPVWLCRPIQPHRGEIRVAVAIDPESEEKVGRDLAVRLLKISRSLADTCSGQLDIVSSWTHDYEDYVKGNVWIQIPEVELKETLKQTEEHHLNALKGLVSEAGIGGNNQIHHLKGRPEEMIPAFIDDQKVDILVMGTVARTGIPGFIIGNTAENVLQKVSCSILAMKPNGFVSPVKPY